MASGYVNRRNAEPVDPAIRTTHVLFALPTFTSHRMPDAISFTPRARRVLCSVHRVPAMCSAC
jgi:hypothetical protein